MKSFLKIVFLLFCFCNVSRAQDKVVTLNTSLFDTHQQLPLAQLDGWLFHAGTNQDWAEVDFDVSAWEELKPVQLSGGELKVETKEGEGSKFIIQLPIKTNQ